MTSARLPRRVRKKRSRSGSATAPATTASSVVASAIATRPSSSRASARIAGIDGGAPAPFSTSAGPSGAGDCASGT